MGELDIRKLAAERGDPFVLSFYLDIDGRRYPRPSDVEPRVEHLFRLARAEAARAGKAAAAAVEADVGAIEAWRASGLDRRRTRGLAAFSCARTGLFTGIQLVEPVADAVVLDRVAHLAPLLGALEAARPSLVVLVDRGGSRFVELEAEEVRERPGPVDGTARRVDTDVELGGFSRLREEALRRHLRLVAAAVDEARAARSYDWLLLGGPEAAALGSELRRAGAPSAVVELTVAMSASAHEVGEVAAVRREELDRQRQGALVRALVERAGVDACLGLGATLEALADGRVFTLVAQRSLGVAGGRCGACGALSVGGTTCPRCGGALEEVADLLEAAIADTVTVGGGVELVDTPELATHGGIGAFLRYRQAGGGGPNA
jgi:peptide chain release factor subunit 1